MGGEAQSGPPMWFIVLASAMVLGVVAMLVVWARRRGAAEQACAGCGRVMLPGWAACKFCGAEVTAAARPMPIAPRSAPATANRSTRPELHFISGPMQGKIVPLEIEVTTIGSAQGNTIVISDTGISKRHVGIKKEGVAFELADLGSTNGVYVNGQKVARRPLNAGDVIRVGVTEIVFRG